MRPQGISRASVDAHLREAIKKYIGACLRQGRNERAEAVSTLYRSFFESEAYAEEKKLEAASDQEILNVIVQYGTHPVNQGKAHEKWAIEALRIIKRKQ